MQTLAASYFLQLAVILLACRLVGWLGKKIGQPQVVGEMIAGVLLGPSLLGWLFPEASAKLFSPETRGILYVGAQLGKPDGVFDRVDRGGHLSGGASPGRRS